MSAGRPFLTAVMGGLPSRRPVWLMRQAGRWLPEYREVRSRLSFLDLCQDPRAAVEVTLQPLRRFDLDAAILFTDLLVPLLPAGVGLRYDPGPRLARRIEKAADLASLQPYDPGRALPFLLETVRGARAALDGGVGLIGFVGAPFTMAAYLVEGAGSKDWSRARRTLHQQPSLFADLLERVVDVLAPVAAAQVREGCDAIQVFDSWALAVGPEDYERFCLPPLQRLLAAVHAQGAPSILYVSGGLQHLASAASSGASCVSVDWRVPLAGARAALPPRVALQGNLDPTALFLEDDALRERVRALLAQAGPAGHVVNLGHGVLPETDPRKVEVFLETVRQWKP